MATSDPSELVITTTALLDFIESTSDYDLRHKWSDIRRAGRVIRRVLNQDITIGIEVIPADERELDVCFGSDASQATVDTVTLALFEIMQGSCNYGSSIYRYMPKHLRLHVHPKRARQVERLIKDQGLSLRPMSPRVETALSPTMKDLLAVLSSKEQASSPEAVHLGTAKGLFSRKLVVPTWDKDGPGVEALTLYRPSLTPLGWKRALDVKEGTCSCP